MRTYKMLAGEGEKEPEQEQVQVQEEAKEGEILSSGKKDDIIRQIREMGDRGVPDRFDDVKVEDIEKGTMETLSEAWDKDMDEPGRLMALSSYIDSPNKFITKKWEDLPQDIRLAILGFALNILNWKEFEVYFI